MNPLESFQRKQEGGLTRRSLLRGLGVSLALPWLESVSAWGSVSPRPRSGAQPPLRFACVFAGNGFYEGEWWARTEGRSMKFGKVLEPLAPCQNKLNFLRGLYNAEALKGNIHSSQTGNILSGALLAPGGKIRSGTSIDQVLAQRLGTRTKVPSLVLGCEKSIASVHKNYSMLYSSHISWSSPTTPTPLEIYPALAFDRLFRDDGADGSDASVLDAVLEEARDLRRRISTLDRYKFDEYLNSVREVERRIERAGKDRMLQGWRPTLEKPDRERPAEGLPQDIHEHMRLMCDILILAFQTDTTRFCTLKLNNDLSQLRFPHLGIDHTIHHMLSHGDSDAWLKVNRYFVEQVAYLAGRMDKIQEGERTLLDNSAILFCSSMLTGNHDASQLPVVLLGRAGGHVETGRVLDYLDGPNRRMSSLYLALASKFGVKLERFGDSDEALSNL
jgi:hypothetical protein